MDRVLDTHYRPKESFNKTSAHQERPRTSAIDAADSTLLMSVSVPVTTGPVGKRPLGALLPTGEPTGSPNLSRDHCFHSFLGYAHTAALARSSLLLNPGCTNAITNDASILTDFSRNNFDTLPMFILVKTRLERVQEVFICYLRDEFLKEFLKEALYCVFEWIVHP